MRFWQGFDETAVEARVIADTKTHLMLLESLQGTPNKQAVLMLETLLDGDIIGLDGFVDSSPRKAELVKMLGVLAKYRETTHYRNGNREVAEAVRNAMQKGVM